jgi:hypothetical protein
MNRLTPREAALVKLTIHLVHKELLMLVRQSRRNMANRQEWQEMHPNPRKDKDYYKPHRQIEEFDYILDRKIGDKWMAHDTFYRLHGIDIGELELSLSDLENEEDS